MSPAAGDLQIADEPFGGLAGRVVQRRQRVVRDHGNDAAKRPVFLIEPQQRGERLKRRAPRDAAVRFDGVGDAESLEDFVDPRGDFSEGTEDDDDVGGFRAANHLRLSRLLDAAGELDDFVVGAGGFDDFDLIERMRARLPTAAGFGWRKMMSAT